MAGAIGLAAAIAFSQDIPDVLRPDLTIAYTDTDGHGQRGDRRPPSSEKFYSAIDAAILHVTGKPRDQTVVMTADYSFLSYYPYWGFQGLTSHYANPLAQFDLRAAQIEKWSKLKTADEFIHALDTCPGRRRRCSSCAAARTATTRCGWPRTSIPTSPTFAATPSTCGPPCSPTRGSPSKASARLCWPSAGRGPNQ